jgi:hypothetical protein
MKWQSKNAPRRGEKLQCQRAQNLAVLVRTLSAKFWANTGN